MFLSKQKTIGIVGGMGPQAGIALYQSLVNKTTALKDQEHLSVVLMSFPGNIGDRTLFLEGKIRVNPAYEIAKVIRKLADSGAEVIGIACNTSYAPPIFDIILSLVNDLDNKPVLLNMPGEVCNYIAKRYPRGTRIGLMATNGTYNAGIYSDTLEAYGYNMVIPDSEFQNEIIHRLIYDPVIGIKANRSITPQALALYNEATLYFKNNNTDVVILGCTELSLLPTHSVGMIPTIDSTECLANALICAAGAGVPMEVNMF